MFSIIIPTFNNLNYLKICYESIQKNSNYNNEIILHINEGSDGTLDFVKKNNINYTYSESNIGLCSAVNIAAKKSSTNFILYSHDDMYFCPDWDKVLKENIDKLTTNLFYLSATMIEKNTGHIKFDCGSECNDVGDSSFIIGNISGFNSSSFLENLFVCIFSINDCNNPSDPLPFSICNNDSCCNLDISNKKFLINSFKDL